MSYEKSRCIKDFYEKRLRRLYPAYAFTIILFSVIFSLISSKSLYQYFTSPTLYKYLFYNLVFLNFVQPNLPGVFQNNPFTAINGALWTLKIEVMFYISVPLIAFFLRRYNKLIIFSLIYLFSCAYLYFFRNIYINEYLGRQLPWQLSYFCFGGMCYYYLDIFNKYKIYLILFGLTGYVANYFINLIYLLPLFMSIIVIFFANCCVYLGNFGKYGDISYGIYIYHCPVIQLILFIGIFNYNPFIALIFVTLILILLSLFSWHFIEIKFLYRTSHYINAAKK
jgi:peptidoglycan/LPS O-acetylase OafA/YrhL